MRTLALVVFLLFITVAGAPSAEPELAPGHPEAVARSARTPATISLELKDVPLKEAIEQLFKATGQDHCYVLDPALDQRPYDKITVSMNLKNMPFSDALRHLLRAHRLTMRKEAEVYHIGPREETQAAYPAPARTPTVPDSDADAPDLVTVTIPQMPVENALEMLYRESVAGSPWIFKDDVGSITMPGARFYRFPREMAAVVTLVAAGLIPPAGDERVVKSKGRVDLSMLIQWTPERTIPPGFSYGPSGGYAYGRYGGYASFNPTRPRYEPAVAIAAYRSKAADGKWLLTVLASQEADTEVLEKLLATSGSRYVMGELTSRPCTTMMTTTDKEGNRHKQEITNFLPGPQIISAQLYDVTLDEALDALLPPIKLIYTKHGPRENPTYVIDVQPIDPDAPVVPTRKPPAGKKKDEKAEK